MRYALLLVTASVLAACTSVLGSDGDAHLEFNHRFFPGHPLTPEVTVASGAGEIVVQVQVSGDPCGEVHGELDGTGRSLRLDVRFGSENPCPLPVIGNTHYTGRLYGLRAGTYHLAVRHAQFGDPSATVHISTVVVD